MAEPLPPLMVLLAASGVGVALSLNVVLPVIGGVEVGVTV